MKRAIALSLLVGASIATAAGQFLKLTGSAEFTVSKAQYGNQVKSIETRFFEQGYDKDARVFKVVTRSVRQTGLDGLTEDSVIEAHGTKSSLYDTKLWTAKFKGGGFQIFNDDLVSVTESGCCDSPDLNRMINAQTGNLMFTAMNESTVEFEVPNSKLGKRYLAQIFDEKAPAKHGTRSYIGTIGYFDGAKAISIARIYGEMPAGSATDLYNLKPILKTKDEFREHTVTVWSADGSTDAKSAFTDLGLFAQFYLGSSERDVSVFIDQDKLSSSKSKAAPDVDIDVVNF